VPLPIIRTVAGVALAQAVAALAAARPAPEQGAADGRDLPPVPAPAGLSPVAPLPVPLSAPVALLPWLAGITGRDATLGEGGTEGGADGALVAVSGIGPTGALPHGPAGPQALPGSGAVASLSVGQLARAITQAPGGSTEIALAPEELGKVRLLLQADAQNPDRMVVVLNFERPETLDLFRRHAQDLTDALRAAGYSETRLDFGQSGFGPGADSGGPDPETAGPRQPVRLAEAASVGGPADPAARHPQRLAAGSLDIRL
jgi:hypothetical protein